MTTQRAKAGRILFGGAALSAAGFFAGLAVAPLAAEDLTGAVTWSGVPGAVGIVGTAIGASLVSAMLRRTDHRTGLSIGYGLGFLGAVLAIVGLRAGSFVLLLCGAGLFGLGHASTQLTRYVVAGLHEPDHRGRALGWIVWAGTIGGVVGPSLIAPAGRLAAAIGQPELVGPYAVGAVAMIAVAIGYQFVLRPDPSTLTIVEDTDDDSENDELPVSVWALPVVRVAITVMVTGQVVMVWLMSMTPVHIRESGGDLRRVGLILSAHILGMYALAPLAGWIEDRLGSLSTIGIALGLLAAAAVLAASAPVGGLAMALALFLLGLGWSFGFVAGSTMLTRGIPAAVRTSVQGRVETTVWLTSAVGSLGAGLLLDVVGFVGLCILALAALVIPAAVILRQRPRLALSPAALR